MTNRKLNFYFFGDIGRYDSYNPAYVCNKENASEILYLIVKNKPFSIAKSEIAKLLNINEEVVENITANLELISVIEMKSDTYRIKFPVFLEEDVVKMENYLNNIGGIIGRKVMDFKEVPYRKISGLECSKRHSRERKDSYYEGCTSCK